MSNETMLDIAHLQMFAEEQTRELAGACAETVDGGEPLDCSDLITRV